jgi:hypothetical protein
MVSIYNSKQQGKLVSQSNFKALEMFNIRPTHLPTQMAFHSWLGFAFSVKRMADLDCVFHS